MQVTAMIAVPAMLEDIREAAAAAAAGGPGRLPSLQRVLVGAGAMSPLLQDAAAALFPNALLSTAYGMTGAASSITFIELAQQRRLMETAPTVQGVAGGADGNSTNVQAAGGADGEAPRGGGVWWGRHSSTAGPGGRVAGGGWPSTLQPWSSSRTRQRQASPAAAGAVSAGGASTGTCGLQHQHAGTNACLLLLALLLLQVVVGEVLTRGPHVMSGYWRAERATQQV